jgi:hypothetical protein
MLQHGLQKLDATQILLPSAAGNRPDQEGLAKHYEAFLNKVQRASHFSALAEMFERGIYDRTKAVFEYFNLPFDAEPPP